MAIERSDGPLRPGLVRGMHESKERMAVALRRVATARRIASAADDAAGIAVASRFRAELRSFHQAVRNVSDGLSMVRTADAGVASTQDDLQRIRELAVQAADGSLSDSERALIQNEIAALKDGMGATAEATAFGGAPLLDGSVVSHEIQVGNDPGEHLPVAFGDLRPASLGEEGGATVAGIDVSTVAGAREALDVVDAALEQTSAARAYIGAVEGRLGTAGETLRTAVENHAASLSRVEDADIAGETRALAMARVRKQSAMAMEVQTRQLGKSTLQLLT